MKISVNAGHSPAAPGASGLLDEVKEARAVKDALIKELKARGHTVSDSTAPDTSKDTVSQQVKKANASGCEIAVSIHLNAGGGTGSEVFYCKGSSKGKAIADKVAPAVAESMGIRNRGVKDDTQSAVGRLGWLRNTDAPAILIEVCFVDSQTDHDAYTKAGASKIADAIATALVGGKSSQSGLPYVVRIITAEDDPLNIRKGPGTNYETVGTVKRGEAFTIVGVQSGKGSAKGWGRLKSGAGFISLDFTEKV